MKCYRALRPWSIVLPCLIAAASVTAGAKDDLRYWLDNMVRVHNYTVDEVREATGLPETKVRELLEELQLRADGKRPAVEPRTASGELAVFPYPGGRHPRSGFLEGAIDPWRETTFSILLPWKGAGYVVVDLQEAL